jgi:D-beta-D-heptose 7-phosphate kinase/D-beta-D-heptose 1-phosphate adenosyltransferase
VRALVIGDLMLDRYIWGQVRRISPEAPVPVVHIMRESVSPGGAGNVATNVHALGGQVVACGIIGRDHDGRRLLRELTAQGVNVAGVVTDGASMTISKTRIIAHNQQVVRLDREPHEARNSQGQAKIRTFVQKHLGDFDVIVVSDYGKGVVDAELLALLAELRKRCPFVYLIDPKQRNFAHYRGASLVKPNKEEAGLATGTDIHDESALLQAGAHLLELWQAEAVLVSRGEEGMSLFKRSGRVQHFPTTAHEVFDVTGAGDTVLATCAVALGAGASFEEATILANHAAGVVVGKVGTATVTPRELCTALGLRKR